MYDGKYPFELRVCRSFFITFQSQFLIFHVPTHEKNNDLRKYFKFFCSQNIHYQIVILIIQFKPQPYFFANHIIIYIM